MQSPTVIAMETVSPCRRSSRARKSPCRYSSSEFDVAASSPAISHRSETSSVSGLDDRDEIDLEQSSSGVSGVSSNQSCQEDGISCVNSSQRHHEERERKQAELESLRVSMKEAMHRKEIETIDQVRAQRAREMEASHAQWVESQRKERVVLAVLKEDMRRIKLAEMERVSVYIRLTRVRSEFIAGLMGVLQWHI